MLGLGASTATDSTAWYSDTGKHTGVVSSILGASLEMAQHRYNKSTLCSREEATEREYCCKKKKKIKEISTDLRNPARNHLQTKPPSVSSAILPDEINIYDFFFQLAHFGGD